MRSQAVNCINCIYNFLVEFILVVSDRTGDMGNFIVIGGTVELLSFYPKIFPHAPRFFARAVADGDPGEDTFCRAEVVAPAITLLAI